MQQNIKIGDCVEIIVDHYGAERLGDRGYVKKFIYEDNFKVVFCEFDDYNFEFIEEDLNYSFVIVEGESKLERTDLYVGMKIRNAAGEIGEIKNVHEDSIRSLFNKYDSKGKRVRKSSVFKISNINKTWFIHDTPESEPVLTQESIDILIDFALDCNDKEWFNSLVERKGLLLNAEK